MNFFYAENIDGNSAILDVVESKHCVKVLRKRKGDQIYVLDGKGGLHNCIIESPDKEACKLRIVSSEKQTKDRSYNLEIAISPIKNSSRFEWFVEKACEIGIDRIRPVITRHTERKNLNFGRLQKILISAMKQSGSYYLPQLDELTTLHDFFMESADRNCSKLMAAVKEDKCGISDNYTAGEDVLVLIGPEGGFSDKELDQARNVNFRLVSLGDSRLRTETAGIYICSSIKILNE